jgi:hypothetical protein
MSLRGATALLVLATIGTHVQAQQSGRTREEVLRELAEARRMGDMVISGCGGGTFREAFPNKYPPRPAATRAPAVEGEAAVAGKAPAAQDTKAK